MYGDFPHVPLPQTSIASPLTHIFHQSGTFVTDEPTLTHRCHTKSVVNIRVHCWPWTFYGFGQMCNDVCPLL